MTIVAFWIGAAMIIYRRPHKPAKSDFSYLECAYFPLWIFAVLVGLGVNAIRE